MLACSKRINSQLITKFKIKKQLIKQRKEGTAITKEIFFYKRHSFFFNNLVEKYNKCIPLILGLEGVLRIYQEP